MRGIKNGHQENLFIIIRQRRWGSYYKSYIAKSETSYKLHSWIKFAYAQKRTVFAFQNEKTACDYIIRHCWDEYHNFNVIPIPSEFERYEVIIDNHRIGLELMQYSTLRSHSTFFNRLCR